ncbi:MAG: ABC transporter ATP-binding protein [Lachnospiraceae bacterium]|nr:ABC transporter ATP-binding protein [Lachnospiraceae bacterium]
MGMILELEQIQKYYGNEGNITKALGGISFAVEEGEFLGIMGASGSGKTTLLNCISTIDTVSAGHIYLYGQQIGETGEQTEETGEQTEGTGQQAGETGIRTEKNQVSDGRTAQRIDITQMKAKELARFRRENLGFVFQDFNLLDTLTISENIALALAINKVPAGEVEGRVEEMCEKLNIGDILHKYPYQVSGGQKQRCACARALINHPKLLLADEPTGALDSHSSRMLLSTMQQINEQLCATILMVTHDAFTASYASRILFLKDGAVFTELRKGDDERNTFFHKILNVLTMIGGGQSHVCETRV